MPLSSHTHLVGRTDKYIVLFYERNFYFYFFKEKQTNHSREEKTCCSALSELEMLFFSIQLFRFLRTFSMETSRKLNSEVVQIVSYFFPVQELHMHCSVDLPVNHLS